MITVTAAIIEKEEAFLVARKRAGLHLAGHWEFPGGKLEENETPEECLSRELMEEFGIHCQVGELVGESIHDYGSKTIRLLGYMVRHLSGDFTLRDHDTIRWLSAAELAESVSSFPWAPADIPLVQAVAAHQFHKMTMAYYHTNAARYVERTRQQDMRQIRLKFILLLPAGGHILDLGCGSGRDAKAFLEEGFTVTAMDASPAIAAQASPYLGQEVLVKKAQDINITDAYHGIWACASLLHLPEWELSAVFKQLARALLPGGILYLSFKEHRSPADSERFFCFPHPGEIRQLLESCAKMQLLDMFTSQSTTTDNQQQKWLNIIARKTG